MTTYKVLVGAALVAGLTASHATAETRWVMPTPYAESHFHTRNIQMFADEIAEKTNGELRIEVHPNGSLFAMPEIMRAVQTGQAPIGEINLAAYANENPFFAIDSIPFVATTYEEAQTLKELTQPEIEAYLERRNIIPLYSVPFPPMGLISKEEISERSDFEGMRFRAFGATAARFGELLGATPVEIQAAEVAQAFSLGSVDGMLTSASTGVATQAWDYAEYFIDMGQAHLKNLVIVNRDAFEALPEEHQQVVRDAAVTAEDRGWQMSQDEAEATKTTLEENGMQVISPTSEFVSDMREIGQTMSQEWAEHAGPEGEILLEQLRN